MLVPHTLLTPNTAGAWEMHLHKTQIFTFLLNRPRIFIPKNQTQVKQKMGLCFNTI